MRRQDVMDGAKPEVLASRVSEQREWLQQQAEHAGHGGPVETVRQEDYLGHHIRVRTTYTLEVDDRPLKGHVAVALNGTVHYHALPNYSFSSAIALVKQIIDAFPQDFPARTSAVTAKGHQHRDED